MLVGVIALAFVLVAEVETGVLLFGPSRALGSVVKQDPVTAAAYWGSLVVFAVLPWLLGRRRTA